MILVAIEITTISNADAQRHGGGGRVGFGHVGYFGRGGGPFWSFAFLPIWGAFYWYLPYASINFYYGGLDYYFSDGVFYQNFDGKYEMVPAPIGYRVKALPKGSVQFSIDGMPYFYYYGTFYKPVDKKYEVIPAPVGVVVESIPAGYEKIEIEGQTYYTVNGVQYKPVIRNNEIWYQVIKSNGNAPVLSSPSEQEQNTKDSSVIN